jgi:hypothetical protein
VVLVLELLSPTQEELKALVAALHATVNDQPGGHRIRMTACLEDVAKRVLAAIGQV